MSLRKINTVLLSLLLSVHAVTAALRVAIKAEASKDYLRERAQNENKKVQTYQFMEGNHFKGRSSDKGVQAITFNDIIQELPQHLVKQNFYPNPELGEGDLLIVVHYGATDFEDDPMELMGIENMGDISNIEQGSVEVGSKESFDLMDSLNSSLGFNEAINSGGKMSRDQKAQMLGIDGLDKPRAGSAVAGNEYENMLKEARYFVVLMAYDFQRFRKKHEAKLLWSTRYSVRTAGQSFETAFKEMNAVAGDYFGMNSGKLTHKRMDDESSVKIGEIEVIESGTSDAESK
ncbi:MAG: hypothetical protein O3C20_07850 [Verrucomicrobia bacterium]|nr:hypothetical protein [Verrucomicrobiota bacterium]